MKAFEVPVSDAGVRPILLAAFPEADRARRPVKVEQATSYRVADYWDGGSRNEPRFVQLDGLRVVTSDALPVLARDVAGNAFRLPVATVELRPGFCVVEHVIFCGKDLGFRLYLHAENFAPMLPASPPDCSDRERAILGIMRSIKAGPYRREELSRAKVTQEEIDALVGRGFLKRASNGATSLTVEGRQASR